MQQIRSQIAEEMAQSRLSASKLNTYQSPQLKTSMIEQPQQKEEVQQENQVEIQKELQQSIINQQQIESDHQILAESLNDQQQQLEIQKSNFNDFTDHINHYMERYSQNLIDIATTVKVQQEEIQFLKQQNTSLTTVLQKQQEQIAFLTKQVKEQDLCQCEADNLCQCCHCHCNHCSEEEYEEESKQSEGEISTIFSYRPERFEDFVGNKKIFEQNGELQTLFRQCLQFDKPLQNVILYGPPACGKTSLALAYIKLFNQYTKEIQTKYNIEEYSYKYKQQPIYIRVKQFTAEKYKQLVEQQTAKMSFPQVVIIDEIQSYNSTQQQSLLDLLEDQDKYKLSFIFTTTEAPTVKVHKGIRSRCLVLQFQMFTNEESLAYLLKLLQRSRYLNQNIDIYERVSTKGLCKIALNGCGDARKLALLLQTSITENGTITEESAQKSCEMNYPTDDNISEYFDNLSALQKSIRASDQNGALLYLNILLQINKCDPMRVARRLCVIAAEDIGLADPQGLVMATSALTATEHIGMPECYLPLTQCVLYLSRAPKDNTTIESYGRCSQYVLEMEQRYQQQLQAKEDYLRDQWGKEDSTYIYPHSFGGYVLDTAMKENQQGLQFVVDCSGSKKAMSK